MPLIFPKWTQLVFRSTVSRDITLFFHFSNSFYFSFQVRFNMLTLKEKRGTIVYLFVTSVILSKKRSVLIWFPWFNLTQLISIMTTVFKAFSVIFLPPLYPLTPVTWLRDWSLLIAWGGDWRILVVAQYILPDTPPPPLIGSWNFHDFPPPLPPPMAAEAMCKYQY